MRSLSLPELDEPRKNPYDGCLYVMFCEGYTKIGITTGDIYSRLLTLQCGNPFEIQLLGVIKSDHIQALEEQLHSRFRQFHIRGEWFKIPNALLQELSWQFDKELSNVKMPTGRLRTRLVDE